MFLHAGSQFTFYSEIPMNLSWISYYSRLSYAAADVLCRLLPA
jgi:hypothetical protein